MGLAPGLCFNKDMTQQEPTFSSYQKLVIAILAFLQFTIILDFMILSPLGAMLMPALQITTSQFGLVVSVYAFSAGASGLLAAGFADRYDRKKLLLFFYVGFLLGTLLCGLATSYHFLLFARMITGLFGGVIGSIVFAITTDLFPMEKRGRVMGVIQTAFAASQVLGIPGGLYLSNLWGWHTPFLIIVGLGVFVGVFIWFRLQPINAHLKLHPDRKSLHHLWTTVSNSRYLHAFATTALLSTGGFMLMPFGSAFSVHNLGISLHSLQWVYMVTGISSIVTGPLVGRLSDAVGKYPMFLAGSILSIVMVVIYTHLGETSLGGVMLVNVILFIGIFSRMIPSQALMSAIPSPADRGSFMSVGSSIQQISGGVASLIAGLIVVESADGKLQHFETLGWVVVGATLITLVMMTTIHRRLGREPVEPIHVPGGH